jgi:hypothetical protein
LAEDCWENQLKLKTENAKLDIMKKNLAIYFILALVIFSACRGRTQSGNNPAIQGADTGKAVISFNEYEHAFGKVNAGEKMAYIFTFRNTGTADLVITSATTSCGCTVSKYNRKPIPSGETGTLEVVFDTSGRNGIQSKTITVNSNATVPYVILKITAEIAGNNQ